ncbi:hypothetical protein [Oceanicaulis sp. MMSF_3324]|uniref:hypothetical protein n=1 Tax=Oceanicaulis sp. MMSF_3324 TaxID=3046702 RepID=UPI00273E69C7|nr:hypothetical protein [Oceanicaulis sp. MMSF_3324]
MITPVLALALSAIAPPEGGVYTLSTPSQSCELLLDATAAPLPETNLDQRDASGFATAMPQCPANASTTSFWSYRDADRTLSLFDPSGAALFTGVLTDDGWQGEIGEGLPATLSRR